MSTALPNDLLAGLDQRDLDQAVLALMRFHDALHQAHRQPAPGLLLLASRLTAAATSGQERPISATPSATQQPDPMTYSEAANASRSSERSIRRRVANGELPAVRIGRLVRIRRADLDAFLERSA